MTHLFSIDDVITEKKYNSHTGHLNYNFFKYFAAEWLIIPPTWIVYVLNIPEIISKGKCFALHALADIPPVIQGVQRAILSPVSVTPDTGLPHWLLNKSVGTFPEII